MRRVRATRRSAALRAALAALSARGAEGEAEGADALLARLLREGEAQQPAWPPSERARLTRARQWSCLLARDDAGALLGWCALLSFALFLCEGTLLDLVN